jgi:hypothetical protein
VRNPAADVRLSEDSGRKIPILGDTILDRHSKLSQHKSDQASSARASDKVEDIVWVKVTIVWSWVTVTSRAVFPYEDVNVSHQLSKDKKRGQAAHSTAICQQRCLS